jgi:hypothetical protein
MVRTGDGIADSKRMALVLRGVHSLIKALNFYPIFIPHDECKVSPLTLRFRRDRRQVSVFSAAAGLKSDQFDRKGN